MKKEIKDLHQANRKAWNEGAKHYSEELQKTIDRLKAGISSVHPLERQNLGDLKSWCESAVHLQCASGEDTLSLLLEGAGAVTGIDISEVHIDNARKTSEALNLPATWHCCDILEIPESLSGSFDLVYTGRGSICWMHDLEAWAAVVARLLKPDGVLHLFDDHPITWLFDLDSQAYQYNGADYFDTMEETRGWPSTYIGELAVPEAEQAPKYERAWPIGKVFEALVKAGLTVFHLMEQKEAYWDIYPDLSPELRGKMPLSYTLMARKPA